MLPVERKRAILIKLAGPIGVTRQLSRGVGGKPVTSSSPPKTKKTEPIGIFPLLGTTNAQLVEWYKTQKKGPQTTLGDYLGRRVRSAGRSLRDLIPPNPGATGGRTSPGKL